MGDPVPDTGILATGPAFVGRLTSGAGAAKSLTDAECLDLLALAFAEAPTTEPAAAGVLWRNNGVLSLSAGTPPTITSQPSSTTVTSGTDATFTVVATNATSYQWSRNTGSGWAEISGATSASLTVTAPTFTSQGYQYRVAVTGVGGTTTSNTATLTIRGLRFQVRGFTDSNFFQATTDNGATSLGTVRLIFKLLELPTSGQKVIVSRVGAAGSGIGGWYVATGWDGAAGAANVIAFAHRNAVSINPTFSPVFTFAASDVGKHFVLHATATNSAVRLYLGGMEVGSGNTPAGNLIAAPSTARVTVGRFQHATGLSCPHLAVVHFETTATVLTAQQILTDAGTIQDFTTDLNVPALPSSIERFDADSLESSTNWAAITGGYTLARNGTLTVEQF